MEKTIKISVRQTDVDLLEKRIWGYTIISATYDQITEEIIKKLEFK